MSRLRLVRLICVAMIGVSALFAGCRDGYGEPVGHLELTDGTQSIIEVGDTVTLSAKYVINLSKGAPAAEITGATASLNRAAAHMSAVAVRYQSQHPAIASVDAVSGFVTGRSPGVATIIGTDDAGQMDTTEVYVTPVVARMKITSNKPMPVSSSQSATLTFGAYDAQGTLLDGVYFWVEITNTSGATWAYSRNESAFHRTPLALTFTVTGQLDAIVTQRRLYAHKSRVVVDSFHVTSAP